MKPAHPRSAAPNSAEAGRSVHRRLAAILAADVAGYTRLMERDTDATMAAWWQARDGVIDPTIAAHEGRIVKLTGDGFLVEFRNVQDAVDCAVALQEGLVDNPLKFRMGVNLGDIVVDARDIYGEGVNIAARLEGLAPPRGICISGLVYETIRNQTSHAFLDEGEHTVKNVSTPIRVWRWAADAGSASATGVGPLANTARTLSDAPNEAADGITPALPHFARPEIVISRFRPIGENERAAIFADGVTEELVATLGSLSAAFVSREGNQATTTSGYTLSGKVRSHDRLRITAKLTRNSDGMTVWASRYDFDPDASYDAQEQIAQNVATALQISLTEGEQASLWSNRTTSLAAWESFHKGRLLEARYRRASHIEARECYARAIKADPNFVPAIAALAFCHVDEVRFGWCKSVEEALSEAEQCLSLAIEVDRTYPQTRALEAYIEYARGNAASALDKMRDVALSAPENPEIRAYYAALLYLNDQPEEAIDHFRRAIASMPARPVWMVGGLGFALLAAGRTNEAAIAFRDALIQDDGYSRAVIGLVITSVLTKRAGEGKAYARRLLSLDPGFRVDPWASTTLFTNSAQREAFAVALRSTGLE
ncbi:MAG: adenylate/guanylate cyclase domain-containing protein [Pseudomonadota bacterium]